MQHKYQPGDKIVLDRDHVGNKNMTFLYFETVYTVKRRAGGDNGVHLSEFDNSGVWWNDVRFKPAPTPIPLYSEKEAVSFLIEKGYVVTPPPEPLKGKTMIVKTSSGSIVGYPPETKLTDSAKVIAIVDWTEGQGL